MRLRRLCLEIFAFRLFLREPIKKFQSTVTVDRRERSKHVIGPDSTAFFCFMENCELAAEPANETRSNPERKNCGLGLPSGCAEFLGLVGFEPTASSSRTRRSTKLSHSPCGLGVRQGPLSMLLDEKQKRQRSGEAGAGWRIGIFDWWRQVRTFEKPSLASSRECENSLICDKTARDSPHNTTIITIIPYRIGISDAVYANRNGPDHGSQTTVTHQI